MTITAYNNEQLRENFFNQTDLTFSFETGGIRHGFLAGVELGEQVTDNFRNTGFFNDVDTSVQAPLDDPTISVPVTFRQSATDADNHGRATIAAVYVQDQIELSPKFEAVLGLRFDQFDMDFTNNRTGDNFEDLGRPALAARRAHLQADRADVAVRELQHDLRAARGRAARVAQRDERGARSRGIREHRGRRQVGHSPRLRADRGALPARPDQCRDSGSERSKRFAARRRPAHEGLRVRRERPDQRSLEHPGRLCLPGRRADGGARRNPPRAAAEARRVALEPV